MQAVEFCPRQFTVPDTIQGWMVNASPCIGESSPIDVEPFRLSELFAFSDNAGAPINYRAENIEGKDFDGSGVLNDSSSLLVSVIYSQAENSNAPNDVLNQQSFQRTLRRCNPARPKRDRYGGIPEHWPPANKPGAFRT